MNSARPTAGAIVSVLTFISPITARAASSPTTFSLDGPRRITRTPSQSTKAEAAYAPASGFTPLDMNVIIGCSPTHPAASSWSVRSRPSTSPARSHAPATVSRIRSADHSRITNRRLNGLELGVRRYAIASHA